MSDEKAKEIIKKLCGIDSTLQLKGFEKEKRAGYIRMLKDEGLSTRQIERLTGISRSLILNT
jgi:putative transposase